MTQSMLTETRTGRSDDAWRALGRLSLADLIGGRYLVHAELGRGGMGEVLRARDVDLERDVALKLLAPERACDPEIATFFSGEVATLALLRSDHVVPVVGFGQHEESFYLVMQLVEGAPLDVILAACYASGAHLPLARALDILARMGAGLDELHGTGLLHRDMKPNAVLIEEGTLQPFLSDFGLVPVRREEVRARVRSARGRATGRGPSGTIVESPGFMAPEAWRGQEATRLADVYAFACTAYELLTGQPVFTATSPGALLVKHAVARPMRASIFRPELVAADAILAGALAKDPEQRPTSCGAVASALVAALGA